MQYLKQSTSATIKLGPFVDDSDGKTAETALSIAQADIRLTKNGGDFAQTNNAAGATHDEFGYYGVPLDTTDTATLGRLRVAVSESGALPVWAEFMVVTANVYDSLCSTDILQSDLIQMGGVAQSGTDLKDFADAGYDPSTNKVAGVTAKVAATVAAGDIATDAITAASVKADAVTKIQNGLSTFNGTGATLTSAYDAAKTAAPTAVDNREEMDSNSTQLSAIVADTNEVQAELADGGRTDLLVDAIKAKTDGLNYTGDDVKATLDGETVETDATSRTASKADITALALESTLTAMKGAGWTDETLKAIKDASAPAVGAIADAVWGEAQSGHSTAGTFGKYLDAAISGVGGATGSGADTVTLTLEESDSTPIADVDVWISTDEAGANVVAGTKQTNSSGEVTFQLDAGTTYYRWAQKDGINFTNPSSFVAAAD